MQQIKKNGKVPVSAKTASPTQTDNDFSMLRIDPELRAIIEGRGLTIHWINAPKYRQGGNYHRSGWRPFQFDMSKERDLAAKFGANAEGYIIRYDVMIGVKTNEEQAAHRERIRSRAKQMSFNQESAKEGLAEILGGKGKVYSGYDDNGEA